MLGRDGIMAAAAEVAGPLLMQRARFTHNPSPQSSSISHVSLIQCALKAAETSVARMLLDIKCPVVMKSTEQVEKH